MSSLFLFISVKLSIFQLVATFLILTRSYKKSFYILLWSFLLYPIALILWFILNSYSDSTVLDKRVWYTLKLRQQLILRILFSLCLRIIFTMNLMITFSNSPKNIIFEWFIFVCRFPLYRIFIFGSFLIILKF